MTEIVDTLLIVLCSMGIMYLVIKWIIDLIETIWSRTMNCKSCVYCRELKKDFIQGKGFTKSNCCIVLAHEEDGFVLEVTDRGFCEMYREKEL